MADFAEAGRMNSRSDDKVLLCKAPPGRNNAFFDLVRMARPRLSKMAFSVLHSQCMPFGMNNHLSLATITLRRKI